MLGAFPEATLSTYPRLGLAQKIYVTLSVPVTEILILTYY